MGYDLSVWGEGYNCHMIDEIRNPPKGIRGMTREPLEIKIDSLVKVKSEHIGSLNSRAFNPSGAYRVIRIDRYPNGSDLYWLGPDNMSEADKLGFEPISMEETDIQKLAQQIQAIQDRYRDVDCFPFEALTLIPHS